MITGGLSALLPAPVPGVTLRDKVSITSQLLRSGATIAENNILRKHLSSLKGGHLALLAAPSPVLALILPAVVGDQIDSIGSGPTAPDPSTFKDAWDILGPYGLRQSISIRVKNRILDGMMGLVPETPKPGENIFANVSNVVIGNNRLALESIRNEASRLGYRVIVEDIPVVGEARTVAKEHMRFLKKLSSEVSHGEPICWIAGGGDDRNRRGKRKGRAQSGVCLGGSNGDRWN